tara:strand:- start:4441 stop:5703 length:1263 start_codon:yes stop_codon:yes gene_type:complete
MADHVSNGAHAPNNPISHPDSSEGAPQLVAGLVRHELVPASVQVQILSIVDHTGSASIGDIVAELPGHPDPVGAIVAMVNADVLVANIRDVLDQHTLIKRANGHVGDDRDKTPLSPSGPDPLAGTSKPVPEGGAERIAGITALPVSALHPTVLTGGADTRRAFGRVAVLQRPGVYVLLSGDRAYVGMGAEVGRRIASCAQKLDDVDAVIAITDTHDGLSVADAQVLERILHARVETASEVALVNFVPDGARVDPNRYRDLAIFAAMACDAIAREGHLFVRQSARAVLAGPRAETGRLGPIRPWTQVPDGEILELCFNGFFALAARRADGSWLLLQGSDVRADIVASASASAGFQRAAWLHSGVLAPSADGASYTVMRDIEFATGSAAAMFCAGSKGRGLAGWRPLDADAAPDDPVTSLAR